MIKEIFKIQLDLNAERNYDMIITFKSSQNNVEKLCNLLFKYKNIIEKVVNSTTNVAIIDVTKNSFKFSNSLEFHEEVIVEFMTNTYVQVNSILLILDILWNIENKDVSPVIVAEILENGLQLFLSDLYENSY
mgnify:FL=1